MQINSNTSLFNGVGTNSSNNFRPDIRGDQKPAAKLAVREAVQPEQPVGKVIDQNDRAKMLARAAYNGQSPRGSIVNIIV